MTRISSLAAACVIAGVGAAHAQGGTTGGPGASPPPPVPAEAVGPSAAPSIEYAVGSSVGWQYRRDFGSATRAAFAPEILAAIYIPTPRARLFLRPAARVGFTGLDQSEQPDTIKIEERDVTGSIELAAVYDGPVIPSLAIGGGALVRFINLDVSAPLQSSSDDISRTQAMGRLYAQIGLGLPLHRGFIVLEPSLRYEVVFGDDRIAWRGSVDISFAL